MEYSKEEWVAKGEELFGPDMLKWEFKCPACGNVQCAEDFRKFKDGGANPNTAYQECMGRYTGGKQGPLKCDWCSYGLFGGPDTVAGDIKVFEFNQPNN